MTLKEAKAGIRKELSQFAFIGTLSSGRGHYKSQMKSLFWWRIEFSPKIREMLKPEYMSFEGLHLTPYFIGKDTISALRNSKTDVFDNKAALPNVDPVSGNIHPEWKPDEWCEDPKIMQAVLVRRHGTDPWGPLDYSLSTENEPFFTAKTSRSQYFPKPDEIPGEIPVKDLLVSVMEQILDPEKGSEILKKLGDINSNK